jgi:tRNA threonylcarbamoyl adenosine modification protein YeaZ
MSWILGIDTSSTDLGIGLCHDAGPVASYTRYQKNSHAEHIEQAVTLMLQGNKVLPGDVTHIAVATGPGSFTGLRIGLAFVKGFCFGGATPVLPVSSLHVLAHGGLSVRASSVIAAIDARRDEVFWAKFSIINSTVVRLTPDTLTPVRQFLDAIQPGDAVITDTMGYALSTVFGRLASNNAVFPVEQFPLQRGLFCAKLGATALLDGAAWKKSDDVLPNYLRDFVPPLPGKRGPE